MKRNVLLFSLILVLSFFGCKQKKEKTQEVSGSNKPNIIFIMVDDLDWQNFDFILS